MVDPALSWEASAVSVGASHARMMMEMEHLWASCSALTATCQEICGLRAPLRDYVPSWISPPEQCVGYVPRDPRANETCGLRAPL